MGRKSRISDFVLILFVVVLGASSCNNGMDDLVNPSPSEPFVTFNFFIAENDSLVPVTILKFNGQEGSTISYFVTRSSTYRVPLPMNEDSVQLFFEYTPSAEGDSIQEIFSDSITFSYTRLLNYRPDGKVAITLAGIELDEHSFTEAILTCSDTVGLCISDEAKTNVFF